MDHYRPSVLVAVVGALLGGLAAIAAIFIFGSLGWPVLWGMVGAYSSAVLIGALGGYGMSRLLRRNGRR